MSLRILQVHAPDQANPFLSAYAANVRWLAPALRDLGHDVTIVEDPEPAVHARSLADSFDVVHAHAPEDGYRELAGRGLLTTGYTARAFRGTAPWVALSWGQYRENPLAAASVIPPALDTAAVPAVAEADRGDHLATVYRSGDRFGLAAAVAVARAAERPLAVLHHPDDTAMLEARLAELGAGQLVEPVAAPAEDPPPVLLSAAACLSFSSQPFDMAALTAMASGTPVIALNSAMGSDLTVHGETGFLARDPEDAARWLGRLDMLDPRHGRQRARAAFDAAVAARLYEHAYRQVAAGARPEFRHPELARTGVQPAALAVPA